MSDILRGFERAIEPLEYLMIWIGLVGIAVGLSLPRDVVTKMREISFI